MVDRAGGDMGMAGACAFFLSFFRSFFLSGFLSFCRFLLFPTFEEGEVRQGRVGQGQGQGQVGHTWEVGTEDRERERERREEGTRVTLRE